MAVASASNQLVTELVGKYLLDEIWKKYKGDLQGAEKAFSTFSQSQKKIADDLGITYQKLGSNVSKSIATQNEKIVEAQRQLATKLRVPTQAVAQQLQDITGKGFKVGGFVNVSQLGQATQAIAAQRVAVDANITRLTAWQKTAQNTATSLLFSYNSLGAALMQFGTTMTVGVTLPVVAAATAAVKTFTTFQQGSIEIQRVAGISAQSANAITEGFRKIATQTPLTVSDLQAVGVAAARAGITGQAAITNFSVGIAKFKKAAGTDLTATIGDVADLVAKLAFAFKASGKDFSNINKITSAFLAIGNTLPGTLQETMDAMRRAVPVAATFHASLADVTAAMGTLVAVGAPATRAGTEFNAALTQFAVKASDVAQALGVSTKAIKERMDKDIIGVLLEFLQRVGQIRSETERTALVTNVFGLVGAKSMLLLANNTDLLKTSLTAARGEWNKGTLVAKQFDLQATSLAGTFTVFANSVKEVAASIGDDLAPTLSVVLKEMISLLRTAADAWKELPPLIKISVVGLAAFLAILGPLLLLIRGVFIVPVAAIANFISLLLKTVLGAASLRAAFVGTGGMAAGFGTVLATVGKALSTLAIRLSLIATAVFIFYEAWTNNWLNIKNITLAVVKVIVDAISGLMRMLGVNITMPKVTTAKAGAGTTTQPINTAAAATSEYSTVSKEDVATSKEALNAAQDALKAKQKDEKDILKVKDAEIKATQKAYDKEIKQLQQGVQQEQDLIDARKESFDAEEGLITTEIKLRQHQLKDLQRAVDAAQKILDQLKTAQQQEVDTAQGALDIAKLNLDAAQNQLKKETTLGKDEFDASFRAVSARVDSANDQVTLAGYALAKTKTAYTKQINIQQAQVDLAKDTVDAKQEELQTIQDSLDDLKDSHQAELDILQKELKVRQDAVSAEQEQRDNVVGLLQDARDAIQEKYDAEVEVLQNTVDAAQDAADKMQEAASAIAELPGQVDDLTSTLEDVQDSLSNFNTSISGVISSANKALQFPSLSITPGSFLDKFGKALAAGVLTAMAMPSVIKVINAVLSKVLPSMPLPGIPKGITGTLGAISGTKALGLTAGVAGIAAASQMQNKTAAAVTGAISGAVGGFQVAGPPGAAVGGLIGAVIGVGPGELMNQIAAIPEFIRTIVWPPIKNAFASLLGDVVKIGGDILGAIGRGIVAAVKLAILTNPVLLVIAFIIGEIIRYWPQLLDIGGKVLGKIGEGILAVLATIQTIGGQVIQAFIDAAVLIFGPIVNLGRNIVGKIIEGITVVWDTISPIAGGVIGRFVSGLGDIWGMMVNVGRNIINGIINGIQALWWYITNIAAQIWGVFANSPLGRAASYAADWGYNLIKGFADGISNAWHWLKQIFDTIVNYVRNNPAVKWMMQSPSRLYKKYGENLMEGLEQGITAGSAGALASFNDVVDSITNAPIAIPNINGLNTGISSNQPGATTGAIVRNVTYNIQPGQMIASKGEVRNFVRMLNDYQRVEEERLSSGGG